jgi:hypothetical protein
MSRISLVSGVFAAVLLWVLSSIALAQQEFRPMSLADMVKAVGTNPEGMPVEELPRRVGTYALHISDGRGVGVSVRFADDPRGPIIVGWRAADRLWQYAWIDEPGLGGLEAFAPMGETFVLETSDQDGRLTSAVLNADLAVVAVVPGRVRSITAGPTPQAPLTVVVRSGGTDTTLTCAVTAAPRRGCT